MSASPARSTFRYKCGSTACNGEGYATPLELENHGCPTCGCKKLAIFGLPGRGDIVIDWRSQKSVRKKKRTNRSGRRAA